MIQNSRYFFYGSPAKYALVGREDQHIWLVVDNLQLAQFISQIFESKITTVVFDLTTFKNYTTDLIDNSVCFNWQVPVNVLSDISVLATNDKKINSILYTGKGLELKNITEHDILLLSAERCQLLQEQLMFLHNICQQVDLTNQLITNKIKDIACFNLELEQLEIEIYNLANTLMPVDANNAVSILKTMNRLYE